MKVEDLWLDIVKLLEARAWSHRTGARRVCCYRRPVVWPLSSSASAIQITAQVSVPWTASRATVITDSVTPDNDTRYDTTLYIGRWRLKEDPAVHHRGRGLGFPFEGLVAGPVWRRW